MLLDRIRQIVTSILRKEDYVMASLVDIKKSLDGLQASEQKLESFAKSTQDSLAAVQAQLAAAQAAVDPSQAAALQAIADEISSMQAGVEAALPAAPAASPPARPRAPSRLTFYATQTWRHPSGAAFFLQCAVNIPIVNWRGTARRMAAAPRRGLCSQNFLSLAARLPRSSCAPQAWRVRLSQWAGFRGTAPGTRDVARRAAAFSMRPI
jgi:hypothetical protein